VPDMPRKRGHTRTHRAAEGEIGRVGGEGEGCLPLARRGVLQG